MNSNKMDHRKKTVVDFIKTAQTYKHYGAILPAPVKYKLWKTDKNIMSKYASWIYQQSNCPSLKLNIPDLPVTDMIAEAMNAKSYFIKHRNDYHPGWYSMAIRAQDNNVHYTDNHQFYPEASTLEHDWTELADVCPITTEWFKDVWPADKSLTRIRFMLLESQGMIGVHSDTGKGNWELQSYNIALTNPDNCLFAQEQAGTIPWQVSDIRAIDVGREHCVYNNSDQDRLHMIVLDGLSLNKCRYVCDAYDQLLTEMGSAEPI